MSIILGIQGTPGSTTERAARFFAQKHAWPDYQIAYLISTANVLRALNNHQINYGVFAWATSRAGLVPETQEAIGQYPYQKIDEENFLLDHALLSIGEIDPTQPLMVYSHPQALREHEPFLREQLPGHTAIAEADTALSAQKLSQGEYPPNSLVIAPLACAEIYHLNIYQSDLPTNQDYFVTVYLAQAN